MYRTREAAWIGYEEAQKTINALKEELKAELAGKKFSNHKKSLKFNRDDACSRVPSTKLPSEKMDDVSSKNEHFRHFVKEVFPNQHPQQTENSKKRRQETGFVEAQKTMNTLKKELKAELAEKKLCNAKKSLEFDRDDAYPRPPLMKSPSEVIDGIPRKKKHFVREVISNQQPQHTKIFKKRRQEIIPKSFVLSNDSEYQPWVASAKVSSIQPKDIKESLMKLAISSTLSKISSSETSSSLLNDDKSKRSSSERTSSLIADTYTNIDAKLSNVIYRKENKKNEDHITFTSWEEEFLKREVDHSNDEAISSQSDKPLDESFLSDMEWMPVFNGGKLPSLKPKRTMNGDLLTLKQIIDRQKRRHEEIQSKSETDLIPSSNYNTNSALLSKPTTKTDILEDITDITIDAEDQFKPPPIRKKCLVTTLPKYKGFSVPGKFSSTTVRKNFERVKKSKKCPEGIEMTTLSKRITKNIKNKHDVSSTPQRRRYKQTVQKDSEKHSKDRFVELQSEQKSDSSSNTKTSNTISNSRSSNHKEKEISEAKDQTLLETVTTEKPIEDYSIDINVNTTDEEQSVAFGTIDEAKQRSNLQISSTTSKSVKRKAVKVHDEKFSPSPKIRHYDAQAVRDYIKKKTAERRKRHLEQNKKSLQEALRKKESLQKLFEFQKQSVNVPNAKTLSPSKTSQKKFELESKDLKQNSHEPHLKHKHKNKNIPLNSIKTDKSSQQSLVDLIHPLPKTYSQQTIDLNNEKEVKLDTPHIKELPVSHVDLEKTQASVLNSEIKSPVTKSNHAQNILENDMKENVLPVEVNTFSKEELPSTSFENQSSNLYGYVSTISTPSELSQLTDIHELPGGLKYGKISNQFGKYKQAAALKKLVKSIGEVTAPYEHLIRTRTWIEQSPPPPNRKSSSKQISTRVKYTRNSEALKDSTDFVMNVAKSLHSTGGNSFIQQVTGIGDTSELYEKILGKPLDTYEQIFNSEDKIVEEDREVPNHSVIQSDREYSLIEGSLESENSMSIKDNEANPQMDSNQTDLNTALENFVFPEFETTKIHPDPYNFINTWNRKPLGIPVSSRNTLKTINDPEFLLPDSESVKHKKTTTDSSSIHNEIYNSKSTLLSTSIYSSSSFISDIDESVQNLHEQSDSLNYKSEVDSKLSREVSNHSSVQSNYTSFVTESLVSEATSLKSSDENTINDLEESKGTEINKKVASPSESSISEVVSVIVNSKNGEKEISLPLNKGKEPSKADISDVSSAMEERKSLIDGQEFLFATNDANSANGSVEKSVKTESPLSEDIEEVIEEASLHSSINENLNHKKSSSSIHSEKKTESLKPEKNRLETISRASSASQNGEYFDFMRPITFTLSGGIPKSLKAPNGVSLHEEQYLHTQVVTRVASEAAAAAASSAVIAVFETQKRLLSKEQGASNILFPMKSPSENSHSHRSDSFISHKTSSDISHSTTHQSSHSQSVSEDTIVDEVVENLSPVSTVKEVFDTANNIEDDVSEQASVSTKTSTSNVISEDLPIFEKTGRKREKIHSRKISDNLSSPSPASLSENESIAGATVVSTNYAPSSSILDESIPSDDSFAQLTLDVIRKITHEEEMRNRHQLSVLIFQEKTLVENARGQMALFESLKKKLKNKGADVKVSLIKKRQKDLILRLRQERAQLRCMQETYRSICEKHHSLSTDEKKLLNENNLLANSITKKNESSEASKASSESKAKDFSRKISDDSSSSIILTEEELKDTAEEVEVTNLVLQMTKSVASNSSQDSIIETIASVQAKSTLSSLSKSHKASPTSFLQPKQGHSQPNLSLPSNNSSESALQGLKKLEASKRHLTKREQRILQRKKHVEKLLQWQKKLDSEEMAVRELEQKALELVDSSKKKTKYYVSSSPSATPNDDKKLQVKEISEKSSEMLNSVNGSIPSDIVLSQQNTKETAPESIQNYSIPEENVVTSVSGNSVEEEWSKKESNGPESSSALSSSSIQEVDRNHSAESSIKTAENTAESSYTEEVTTNGTPSNLKHSNFKTESNLDVYSESFESAVSQKSSSPISSSPALKMPTPSSNSKNRRSFIIKSPLTPHNLKRHDSSGSDDSYTISHSETASDQSDIEVRIHALAEELRRRKYEAEKLKREQKRRYREHLKGTELSLQKQVEAYTQYIQQVKADLEQIEATSSQPQIADTSSVKPQIKWPRSENTDSRRIRKHSPISPDAFLLERKPIDNASSSPDSIDSSLDLSDKKGKLLIGKKLYPETREKPKFEIDANKRVLEKENVEILEISKSASVERSSAVGQLSEIISGQSRKSSVQSKEEPEIEELYESNSSIVSVDSLSENKITDEVNSKTTYQSDSFISNSSIISPSFHEGNDSLKIIQKAETVQEGAHSMVENLSIENSSQFTEEVHPDFENSHNSEKIAPNESVYSSEEYTSESSVNTNTASVKEDLESGSFECENSDGCSTPSPRKTFDKTSTDESEGTTILTFDDKMITNEKKSTDTVESEKPIYSVSKNIKDGLNSETFIVNVVKYLYSSMFDDAMKTLFKLSRKTKEYLKPNGLRDSFTGGNAFDQSYLNSVGRVDEESLEIITNNLLKLYLNEAVYSILNIANDNKQFALNGGNIYLKETTRNDQKSEFNVINSTYLESMKQEMNLPHQTVENDEVKNSQSVAPVQHKIENSIFKKHADWFEDGIQWDSQQLEQQLLLQQYPYYYRKIPNKPPPPYTPPAAVVSINAQYTSPLPVKKEKPLDKVDPIKYVTKHIDLIVDCIVNALLDGKNRGLMISDITQPDLSPVVEQLDLRIPCQLTFLDLIFDLTKEIALDIYNETEEVREPWLRPRKLTPKPIFPMNKTKLITALQKEVEKALKIVPSKSFAAQRRKKPTWSNMKLGRKKRDFVDTILISEIKGEEPDWVNYDQDEVTVKIQIADSIFDHLIDDTVSLIKDLERKLFR